MNDDYKRTEEQASWADGRLEMDKDGTIRIRPKVRVKGGRKRFGPGTPKPNKVKKDK